MEAIPKDVIECAILDGQLPQSGEGAKWCEGQASCYRCAKDIHDMMAEEIRHLKAERDRALAELDKALGEREDALLSASNAGFNEGFDAGYASADDWFAQNENAMREHGWIRLPLGEDGEPIRIGELVDEKLPFGGYAAPAPIDTMELSRGASGYGWMVKLDAENRALISPKLLRHHRAPTVEDVLTEFGIDWEHEDNCEDRAALLAEYAAKLRLAGDAE